MSASERNQAVRAEWRQAAQQLDTGKLVFIDESGSHIALTPLYAWAPRSERAYGSVPRNRGENTTIVGALSQQGVQAAMTVEGAADALVFEAFIEHVLMPTLQPAQIVIMDNLSIQALVFGALLV